MKKILGALFVLGALWFRGQTPRLEVSSLNCTIAGRDIVVTGTVTNISNTPLSLGATAAVAFSGDTPAVKTGLQKRLVNGAVRPNPLEAGTSGRFEIRAQMTNLPTGVMSGLVPGPDHSGIGDCRLEPFTDEATGTSVAYRER